MKAKIIAVTLTIFTTTLLTDVMASDSALPQQLQPAANADVPKQDQPAPKADAQKQQVITSTPTQAPKQQVMGPNLGFTQPIPPHPAAPPAPQYAANVVFLQQNIYTIQTMRLVSSDPQPNTALNNPPVMVTLYFSAPVDPANSQLNVFDPYGNKISSSPIFNSTNMSVSLTVPKSGYSGAYNVQWVVQCLCSDSGNRPSGTFGFSIN